MSLRAALAGFLVVTCVATGAAVALGLDSRTRAQSPRAGVQAASSAAMPPLPKPRPQLEPVAGNADTEADEEVAPAAGIAEDDPAPKPSGPASSAERKSETPSAIGGGTTKATALSNGVALAPLEAPAAVLKIIEAGNAIARAPYKWGGGHGRWKDTGYDCSGSVSFALYFAGLLDGPRDSSGLMSWGEKGRGRWVTVYANPGHVFMEVAGIRFDTSGAKRTGSRWQTDLRRRGRYPSSGRSLVAFQPWRRPLVSTDDEEMDGHHVGRRAPEHHQAERYRTPEAPRPRLRSLGRRQDPSLRSGAPPYRG